MKKLNKKKLKKPKHTCHPELLANVGFSMRIVPLRERIDMCPTIRYSCCARSDQKIMFKNWVLNEERKNINERFNFYQKVYLGLFTELQRV